MSQRPPYHNAPGWERECPNCGHLPLEHHGSDGRDRPDAGCMALGSMRDDRCRCTLTATEARDVSLRIKARADRIEAQVQAQ